MSVSKRRVRAIFRKELREYRRNGAIVSTMAVIPLIFLIQPLIQVFALPASASSALAHKDSLLYAFFLACVELFAHPAIASALLRGPELLAQLLSTPLLAGWSIWVGMAISARSSDVRATLGLALGLAAALLLGDGLGWRIVSATFDRERLVTGTRS